jgi:hypothetical protein
MKQTDRFLLAIIAGVVLLVIAALALALTRSPQAYLPETTPDAIAFNYVLALKQGDSAKAYGYLSPELKGYPPDAEAFAGDINRYNWSFDRDAATIDVGAVRPGDERTTVTISETRFSQGGLFNSGQYTTSFDVTLRAQGDTWKIVDAQSYWAPCWDQSRPCE